MQGSRLEIQGSKARRLEARGLEARNTRLEGSRLEGSRLEGSTYRILGICSGSQSSHFDCFIFQKSKTVTDLANWQGFGKDIFRRSILPSFVRTVSCK